MLARLCSIAAFCLNALSASLYLVSRTHKAVHLRRSTFFFLYQISFSTSVFLNLNVKWEISSETTKLSTTFSKGKFFRL